MFKLGGEAQWKNQVKLNFTWQTFQAGGKTKSNTVNNIWWPQRYGTTNFPKFTSTKSNDVPKWENIHISANVLELIYFKTKKIILSSIHPDIIETFALEFPETCAISVTSIKELNIHRTRYRNRLPVSRIRLYSFIFRCCFLLSKWRRVRQRYASPRWWSSSLTRRHLNSTAIKLFNKKTCTWDFNGTTRWIKLSTVEYRKRRPSAEKIGEKYEQYW